MATVMALVALGLAASPARGAETHPFVTSFGSFANLQGLALDQSSGAVYALDVAAGSVSRFDAAGNPVAFSAAAPYISGNVLTGTSAGAFEVAAGESEAQIAVAPPGSAGGTAGDLYVTEVRAGGSVAVFAPSGEYLGAIDGSGNANPSSGGQPCGVAVAPGGALYIGYFSGHVDKYVPSANPPLNANFDSEVAGLGGICNVGASSSTLFASTWSSGPLTSYPLSLFPGGGGEADASSSGTAIEDEGAAATSTTLAVDPSNGDLYVDEESQIAQLDSTGGLIGHSGAGVLSLSHGVAIDATGGAGDGNLYAANGGAAVAVFGPAVPLPEATTGAATGVTASAATLNGTVSAAGGPNATCAFQYVDDAGFQASGFEAAASAPCSPPGPFTGSGDNPVSAALSGLQLGTAYHFRLLASSTAGTTAGGNGSFTTLGPRLGAVAVSEIADTSARLEGVVNPGGETTTYRFQYVTEAGFQESGYAGATSVPSGGAPAGSGTADVAVAQQLTGLSPGTAYHFRLLATNPSGTAEGSDQTFATFLPAAVGPPDGRGYELVSPPDTNGAFLGTLSGARNNFDTTLVTPDGESVLFYTQGTLPGMEGNGTIDSYEATRGAGGWSTRITSPRGSQAVAPVAGGTSPDHHYSFWNSGNNGGSLDTASTSSDYIRKPDGSFELAGRGILGDDTRVQGRWITPGATHVVFSTEAGISVKLEPNAPAAKTAAIYDRTPGGPTHVVSLLPAEVTPSVNASYLGTSEDGSAVVFEVAGTMYERRDNSVTLLVASGAGFAGVSSNGDRVFYTKAGNAFAFDAGTKTSTPIGSGGASTVVNVSADGSHVYFVSTHQLDGGKGEEGARNLYVWDGGAAVGFIAVLSPADFSGAVNLGRWAQAIGPVQNGLVGRAIDPSRTTPDGSVFVFQSHAVSTLPYDSEGHWEIYRYDDGDGGVACLSCSPVGFGSVSNAELESTGQTVLNSPTKATSRIRNVTDDGTAVFFQTGDALVLGDTDGVSDVYEWKEGSVSLISSGRSANANYLIGMTADGHDVFFKTGDALVPQDKTGGSGSIYDARIGGGFPAPAALPQPCSEASCQGPGSSPPLLPGAGSAGIQGPGNQKPRRHRAKHHRKHHHKKKHRRAGQRRAGHSRGDVR